MMIKNYFKIAWRNLLKNKGYSAINIIGLSFGIVMVMLIGLWIHDEVTFNKNHDNYDRIAHVLMHKSSNGEKRTRTPMPFPIGNELREHYGDNFEHVVMSSYHGDNILSKDDNRFAKYGGFMEPDALRMLSLNMVYGDSDGLANPNSIVLSESTAVTFFGNKNPIGETMQIGNMLDVTVTGVFKDLPHNAEFHELEFIAPWELYVMSFPWVKRARDKNLWDNNSYQLYVQIAEGTTMKSVTDNVKNAVYNNLPEYSKRSQPELVLHPMKNWHLRSNWRNGINTGGFIQYVWLFGIIGLFVLILACINFMNLSTAQSEKRAKEVGIRKSIGSSKKQLIGQFLTESFLVVILAFALALLLVFLVLPAFNQLADKDIELPINSISFYFVSVGCMVAIALMAGSYPAFYLSSFRPVKVLKGVFNGGKSTTSFRKALVVVQFTVSVVLIIGAVVVEEQIAYSKNRPIGYENNGLIMISKDTEDYEGKYNAMRTDLRNSGAVLEMGASSSPLTGVWSTGGGFEWPGKDPNFLTNIVTVCVSHDYGKTVGWNIKEGRDFSREFATDSTAFIINEAAVNYMGLKDPIGKMIKWGGKEHRVIGVVEDILAESPFEPVRQAVYMIKYDNTNWIEIKLNPERSTSEALASVASIVTKHVPNVPFDYKFVDDTFAKKFVAIERIQKLSTIFAFFAIFISCLGLLGLASFMAEQRTKEIGIRKVIGASVFNLWKLLSQDFVKLVLIAIIIATPFAYYGVILWLDNYTYKTEVSWWIFVSSGLGALAITLLTISFQAIKAAIANPIKSLRTE